MMSGYWYVVLGVIATLAILHFSGKPNFWKLTRKYPEEALRFFEQNQDVWRVFYDKPVEGYHAHVPIGEWTGPFRITVPSYANKQLVVYGRSKLIEESQELFVQQMKSQNPRMPRTLVFKGDDDFFEYQCAFGCTEIIPKRGIVAVMLDCQKEFGASEPVKIDVNGQQIVGLKVVSRDGGFIVPSRTLTGNGDRLKPGDAVFWVPTEYSAPRVDAVDEIDPRLGWVGFVAAKIDTRTDPTKSEFDIICRYD